MATVVPLADSNDRLRRRRDARRKQIRRRRRTALAIAVTVAALATLGVYELVAPAGSARTTRAATPPSRQRAVVTPTSPPLHRRPPREIRGVHVTMDLANLKGKLNEYLALKRDGLNTIELDVKDESGDVAFVPSAVPLASAVGAARPYYRPRAVARAVHAQGIYLIGRVVTFEDPRLAEKRPELAIHTADGSIWRNNGGLGWANPYDHRVWDYAVSLGEAAARAGFDEIQFDYVRFPSDGDLSLIRYPGAHPQPMGWTIPAFVQYASARLHKLHVRVSVDVFGLSATRDLGIGQLPRRVSRYVDAVYPMVYPSHYNRGEYGLPDPNAEPGATVSLSLADFHREMATSKARLVPWLQDFSLGRTYTIAEVRAQVDAARQAGTGGFMLWNAEGVYTGEALRKASVSAGVG